MRRTAVLLALLALSAGSLGAQAALEARQAHKRLEALEDHHDAHHHAQGEAQTYWDLARRVVPQAIFAAFGFLPQLSANSGPDDVKPLRIALLHAREALDIFSFALPANFSTELDRAQRPHERDVRVKHQLDLWDALRKDLDAGYEVLGNFQDLAHALVEYNDTDVQERLGTCLQWLDTITVNRIRYGYDAYLAHIADNVIWKHQHISKLFWGYKHVAPSAELSGMGNVLLMVRGSQVPQIMDNFTVVTDFQHVYQEPDHARFHLFRKLIRSLLAVLEFFPEILPPAPSNHKGHKEHHHEHHHKKEHRRGAGLVIAGQQEQEDDGDDDRYDDDGTAPSDYITTSSSRRLLRKGGKGNAVCDPPSALTNLQSLFKNLGQVNNKVFAYEFYTEKGMAAEADQARQECDAAWVELRKWMVQVRLLDMVQCLSDALVP